MNSFFYTTDLCRYFGGVKATNNVNFKIEENELRSLIGPNGAGKTTLVNVITGRIPASSGSVFYQAKDITNKPPYLLVKRGISRTFQISSFFPDLTVFENIRVANQAYLGGSYRLFSSKLHLKEVNEKTWNVLEQLGLVDVAEVQAANLAYGDQRVLEVAISLSSHPKIMFLDEPTAGMSPAETRKTTQLIRSLTKDMSIVLIEHDMEVVMSISDTITVLQQGTVIAEGTPEEIRENEQVKEAYLGKEK
jgi:branched-chain amino acid transport system ATP-binding protein